MEESIQILELFGGIGSPRCALRNLGIKTKAIDYVEIDENAVRSYNAMFAEDLEYKTQSVVGWNLKPDILIHGSPCQDMSIAGHQGKATAEAGRINRGKGADKGSGTRSSLMWETIHIIQNMGEWKPKYVIWENVKNVLNGYNRKNFEQYISEMGKLGYTSNYQILDARDFGLPQARERVFTVSVLNGDKFEFQDLIRTPMRNISSYADIVDAIHVVQTEMGITGTTAKEASTTIEGSINSTKAAWSNLLTGFANDEADVGALITDLCDSVATAANNLIPRVIQAVTSIVENVPIIIQGLAGTLTTVFQEGQGLITSLMQPLVDAFFGLINAAICWKS